MNADGTRIVEVRRQHGAAFGFYVARSTAKFNHAIIVSRFAPEAAQRFVGLLAVGDQLRGVNGRSASKVDVEGIYEMMAENEKLELLLAPVDASPS